MQEFGFVQQRRSAEKNEDCTNDPATTFVIPWSALKIKAFGFFIKKICKRCLLYTTKKEEDNKSKDVDLYAKNICQKERALHRRFGSAAYNKSQKQVEDNNGKNLDF